MHLQPQDRAVRLVLEVKTAADLMTSNPQSIRQDADIDEAVAFFADKDFGAAPVIDEAGRPVGVLSRTDILAHAREKAKYPPANVANAAGNGQLLAANVDRTPVGQVMNSVVFFVPPEAPAAQVVEDLLNLRVHRLFVVDRSGVLVGVVSTVDVLRHLHPEGETADTGLLEPPKRLLSGS